MYTNGNNNNIVYLIKTRYVLLNLTKIKCILRQRSSTINTGFQTTIDGRNKNTKQFCSDLYSVIIFY